jgi:hypothetical protein
MSRIPSINRVTAASLVAFTLATFVAGAVQPAQAYSNPDIQRSYRPDTHRAYRWTSFGQPAYSSAGVYTCGRQELKTHLEKNACG